MSKSLACQQIPEGGAEGTYSGVQSGINFGTVWQHCARQIDQNKNWKQTILLGTHYELGLTSLVLVCVTSNGEYIYGRTERKP